MNTKESFKIIKYIADNKYEKVDHREQNDVFYNMKIL